MKQGIHPENYREVLFYDASAQQGWIIRSCAATSKTMTWTDGKEYPFYPLDTSSASHPVYTGKRREANTEGRASRFSDKFKGMASLIQRKG
ncbi:type B 50S ribosomal protein L31 [Haemophilus sputorum]|jgi:ribosomal protein L31|uniref:Large ribosomal subunit protein bL31B n=1 Tax=Haemophilus sputorum TaxID=1078480 RepID=A0A369YKY8_9PAST|nr:type B 50S ribosomal protein L31 [Haemophilus sputorum]EJP28145.1 ribosomal protein L31 [Haemophilus sputorum HK 2154]MCQ1857488.1 type B 50S ribosomal protein L31 [Haemophilus sputorum]RDE72586.1 type B 50S ribosomal protein L31 [Haemophilus sputorum]RDF08386.1 type B 50S ribosomal protein L31 [Haemophilus sputorum]RDF10567.1 type B 50S ribosomal protein L31 [Haemophilus sputorum]